MKDPNQQIGKTHRKILDAACRLFAEKGYRGTTVAVICQTAGVNIAAVNYHFRSKESLYQESWRYAHNQLMAMVPPDGSVSAGKPAAQRLRGIIKAGLQRAMLGDAVEFKIMRNEMANPTGLLRQVIDDAIRPIRQATQAILRELLGEKATDMDVELCEVCVIAPQMLVTHHKQAEKHKGMSPVFREKMLETMVDYFSAFALAGIREISRQVGKHSTRRCKKE